MRKKIDYIYYRFYQFQVSIGNATVAVPLALIFLCYLVMLNFFSIIAIMYALAGIKMSLNNAVRDGIIISTFFLVMNFFLFIYRKRYKKIIKMYQGELKQEIRGGNLLVVIYMVSTFVLIGIGFYLMILHNKRLI